MKNSDDASPNAASVIPRLCTICSFAKPTFCRSMNAIRNITTRMGSRRRAIFDMMRCSSADAGSRVSVAFT